VSRSAKVGTALELGGKLFGAVVLDTVLLPLEVAGHFGFKNPSLPAANLDPLYFLSRAVLAQISDELKNRR
jgi:hypothetical protein